jgi:hypothetical protein
MTAQGVNITIQDNQLGQAPPGQGQTELVIGCGSSSTYNYTPITSTNPNAFTTGNNYGPGPELAAFIANQTGNPVTLCQVPAAGVGTNTTVYAAVTNNAASTAAATLSGTPNDDGYFVVTCITDGNAGAGTTFGTAGIVLGISRDGGATNFATVSLLTATAVTTGAFTNITGLSLATLTGKIYTGDKLYWVSTGPTYSDAAVQSALQAAIKIQSQTFQDIFVPGGSSAASGAGALGAQSADVTAFDGYMSTLATTSKRFSRLLCSARDAVWGGASTETELTWIGSLETQFASSSSLRVGVCAGHYRFISQVDQSQLRRNLLWGAGARDSAVLIQVDLGEVDLGGLQNLVLPVKADPFGNGNFFYHDESMNPGLDAARMLAAWQIVGQLGVYIMNPNLMAPVGSDFNWLQHGHVIDVASAEMYTYFTKLLSKSVRVSAKTGFILPQDRNRIQAGANAVLANGLVQPGAVSAAFVVVSPSDNILSTATLTVTLSVVPLGYIKAVNLTIQFLNPAYVVVQQAA